MSQLDGPSDTGLPASSTNSIFKDTNELESGDNAPRRVIIRPSEIGRTGSPNERGVTAYHNNDYNQARREFQIACNNGTIYACVNLAGIFANLQDYTRARELYLKACNGGVFYACRKLGQLYENAKGGPQDYALARGFYERACDGGGKYDCSYLGRLTFLGLGGEQDQIKGENLLRTACTKNGDTLSCVFLSELGLEQP